MDTLFWIIVIAVIVMGGIYLTQSRGASTKAALADAQAEAKRWTERLGGQVFALDPKGDPAATQAIADAAERHTAAVSQIEQASTVQQYRLAQQTAYEGLYYISAARKTLGLDPGPELPAIPGQARAGAVTERREVEVGGESYEASPNATERSRYYYPGGNVAGRPVPQGWYSQPWWKPALVAGAWGVGSFLLMNAMFTGMAGTAYADGFEAGLAEGGADGGDAGGEGGDAGGDAGGEGGDMGGDFGDAGGDFSGGGFSDWGGGGGDFGGGDF
jgi:hypothetical protein